MALMYGPAVRASRVVDLAIVVLRFCTGELTRVTGSFSMALRVSRAHAMKSCANGLRVRFFRVMIAVG